MKEGHVGKGERVVDVECLCDLESVCVVLSGGDILMCNTTSMEVRLNASTCCMHFMPCSPYQILVQFHCLPTIPLHS